MKRFLKYITTVFVIVTIISKTTSFAYSLNGHKISSPIKFVMHNDFDYTTFMNFNHGLAKWNGQAGKTIMTRNSSIKHSKNDYPATDGQSSVYRKAVDTSDYLAQASYRTVNNSVITEADINVNVSNSFSNGSDPNTFDIYSILMHEAGHVAGLSHSKTRKAIMYESFRVGEQRRNLNSDDINGINRIYK